MGVKTDVGEKEIGVLDLHGNLVGIEETKVFQQPSRRCLTNITGSCSGFQRRALHQQHRTGKACRRPHIVRAEGMPNCSLQCQQ